MANASTAAIHGFSMVSPAELVGRRAVGKGKPAIDLVHVAEVALEIPDERDAAVIEVRKVDAGAEHAPSLVFRVLDDGAAHHGNFGRAIEQRQIDADFGAIERGLVLRVEEARIVLRDHGGLADPAHGSARELHHAIALELRQQCLGVGPRQQHGMAEMPSGTRAAEHGGQEQALVDLEPALVALDGALLRRDLLRGRDQPRDHAGGPDHQILDPHETRPPHRQRVIDGIAVAAKKPHTGIARPLLNRARGGMLARIAARLGRQPPQEPRRFLPIGREFSAVGGKIGGLARLRLQPLADVAGGQARRREAFHGACVGLAYGHDGAPTVPEGTIVAKANVGHEAVRGFGACRPDRHRRRRPR